MTVKPLQRITFLQKVRRFFLILCGTYFLFLVLLTVPFVQRQFVYAHNVKVPIVSQYGLPEKYYLARKPYSCFRTPKFQFLVHVLPTNFIDNETIGAWFTLADPFYVSHKADLLSPNSSSEELIRSALRDHPTILFLHGITTTRTLGSRVQYYQAFSARLRANVLAPDYRGFGDSTGTPSEDGLTLDARAAWDWLRERGTLPENILIVGNSLGTGVAVNLASVLDREGERGLEIAAEVKSSEDERGGKEWRDIARREQPRGIVLLSPFSNIETLLDTFVFMRLVPLFVPLRPFPYISKFAKRFLIDRFDTIAKVVGLKVPLLIVHAEDDWDIPYSHSQALFNAFLEQHLPPLPEITTAMESASDEVAEGVAKLSQERAALRQELVTAGEIERLGRVEVFSKDRSDRKVAFIQTRWGGHYTVGLLEGVQDYIAEMFNIGLIIH